MDLRRRYLALFLALASVGACAKSRSEPRREVDPALIRLDSERLNLRHGEVGVGKWETRATFVLIDAHNDHHEDVMVTVAGDLVNDRGEAVGQVRGASLRVPAGGVRTFALVDREQKLRPDAVGARLEVVGAHSPGYPPPVQITDGKVHRDGDRIVVNGIVRNTAERPVKVIVAAGFYDPRGVPLTRPFTVMEIGGLASQSAQFVGPPGGVRGYIFVDDMVY